MTNFFVEVDQESLNKEGEELCGDSVKVLRTEDSVIVVLADGLGSGVKANILSTMTGSILGTMLKEGMTIDESIDTISNTLPIDSVRNLAYSTFTVLQIFDSGKAYLAEYGNPELIFIRDGMLQKLKKHQNRTINGRNIYEANFTVKTDDVMLLITDGVTHAGVGEMFPFGWQWDNAAKYTVSLSHSERLLKGITKQILRRCYKYYQEKPKDDTTVVGLKIHPEQKVTMMIGPPVDKTMDAHVVDVLMKSEGVKIVCGGTTSKIVAKELGEELEIHLDEIRPNVPPVAHIKSIDLVIEGALTLSLAFDYIKRYFDNTITYEGLLDLHDMNAATKLTKILVEDCTELHLLVGKAMNPAHENIKNINLDFKLDVIRDMADILSKMGKKVTISYY